MKKLKKSIQFLFLLLVISCEKPSLNVVMEEPDVIVTPIVPTTFSDNFGPEINSDFIGSVLNENSLPVAGANIIIGASSAVTDENGVFIIEGATVNEKFAYIKASKSGYINGSRTVIPTTGTNNITIMLLEQNAVGTTNSGEVKTIASNGASVTLNGAYVKEDGSNYSGAVKVHLHHLNPIDENMSNQMPGMLYAENSDGEERMLQTLGMLSVELKGSAGEDLNISTGSSAEITIPLDPSLLPIAPSTIPLWYFDEENGYWKEEGEAVLTGTNYVGTVTHFSFWNCDIPAEAVRFNVSVTDDADVPLVFSHVTITSNTFGTRGGFTNEDGVVNGLIPSNEVLVLEVFDADVCGTNPIYTESIGPFSNDASLEISVRSNVDIISETIKGNFTKCDDTTVSKGYVIVSYGNDRYINTVTDGNFEVQLLRCTTETTFSIKGYDYESFQGTGEINYTFSTPTTNLGTLISCNSIKNFISYQIDDDEPVYIIDPPVTFSQNPNSGRPVIEIGAYNQGINCFWLRGNLTLNSGSYVGEYLASYDDFYFVEDCPFYIGQSVNNVVFNVTSFGDVGEYIDINFAGNYDDFEDVNHSITGTIHVLRSN